MKIKKKIELFLLYNQMYYHYTAHITGICSEQPDISFSPNHVRTGSVAHFCSWIYRVVVMR